MKENTLAAPGRTDVEENPNGNTEPADFSKFGLSAAVLQGVEEAGFKTPSPIQSEAMPEIMAGRDIIGQAHTGTGKTAAFGLPALSKLKNTGRVEVLVITPTRELAMQVSDELYRLGQFIPVQTFALYGGQPYGRQLEMLRRGAQVAVATPGRLLDLMEGGKAAQYIRPSIVVLDEADEMLDMGFLKDVEKIFSLLRSAPDAPPQQTLLFSATMPPQIRDLALKFLKDPVTISTKEPGGSGSAANRDIEQLYYVIEDHEREDATVRLIDTMEPDRALVFCRTKREVDRLAVALASRGVAAQSLHGDMDQPMRERATAAFRRGDFQVLVATDVAARGLDIVDLTHVFNYHIPFDSEGYVHRIGRTGRAGKKGVAVTLVTPHEYHQLRRMQRTVGQMENRLIPSHSDLRKAAETRLIDEIRSQAVTPETEKLLVAIEEEIGLAQAAHKMLARLMADASVSGPDRIGVQGPRLEKVHQPPKKTPYQRNRFDGPPQRRSSRFGGDKKPFDRDRDRDKPRAPAGKRGFSDRELYGTKAPRKVSPFRQSEDSRDDYPKRKPFRKDGDKPPRFKSEGDRPDRFKTDGERPPYKGKKTFSKPSFGKPADGRPRYGDDKPVGFKPKPGGFKKKPGGFKAKPGGFGPPRKKSFKKP